MLTRSANPSDLTRVYARHGERFNHVHMSAFWSTLGKHVKRSRHGTRDVALELRDNEALFAAARAQTIELLPRHGSRELANVAHGLASAGLSSSGVWADLWKAVEESSIERLSGHNSQGLANTVWAFATARHVPSTGRLFEAVVPRILELTDEASSQGLANVAWAYATVASQGLEAERTAELFRGIAEEVVRRGVGEFKAQEICNLVWSFATVGADVEASKDVFRICAEEIVTRLDECTPQTVSNILWAYATIGDPVPYLFDTFAWHATPNLHGYNQQELSLTAWAFATVGYSADALFDAIAEQVVKRVDEFNPQGISNVVWAFAVSSHESPALYDATAWQLAQSVREAAEQGRPIQAQAISLTAWSLASAGYKVSDELKEELIELCLPRIDEFNQQGLSNLAWAFAQFGGEPSTPLFTGIASAACRLLPSFQSRGLSNLLWSYAKLSVVSDELFAKAVPLLVAAAAKKGSSAAAMSDQSVVQSLWAYAVLGYASPSLFSPMASIVRERLDEFAPQGLANVGWSFAVADVQSPEVDALFSDGAFAAKCESDIGAEPEAYSSTGSGAMEHLRQLHQWELWRELASKAAIEERGCDNGWPAMSEGFTQKCAEAFAANAGVPSALQRQVLRALLDLGLEVEEEVHSEEGYTLDILIHTSLPKKTPSKVAIEVDGPTHFLHRTRRPAGATHIKRRQLRQRGWTLIPVPYFDWRDVARGDGMPVPSSVVRERRKAYLAELLGLDYVYNESKTESDRGG